MYKMNVYIITMWLCLIGYGFYQIITKQEQTIQIVFELKQNPNGSYEMIRKDSLQKEGVP